MMKKTLSLVLAVGLLFLLGCEKQNVFDQQDVSSRQTYTNEANGFSLQFPPFRTFQENVYESLVMFLAPITGDDQIKENVGIMKKSLDKEYTPEEYYAITKPSLIKDIPGFVEITSEKIKINGENAQKNIYKGTPGNNKLQWEQLYFVKNKNVYIITYLATESTFNQYMGIADQMINTFEID